MDRERVVRSKYGTGNKRNRRNKRREGWRGGESRVWGGIEGELKIPLNTLHIRFAPTTTISPIIQTFDHSFSSEALLISSFRERCGERERKGKSMGGEGKKRGG